MQSGDTRDMGLPPLKLDSKTKVLLSVDAPHSTALIGVQLLESRLLSARGNVRQNQSQAARVEHSPVYTTILRNLRMQTCKDTRESSCSCADACHALNSALHERACIRIAGIEQVVVIRIDCQLNSAGDDGSNVTDAETSAFTSDIRSSLSLSC